MSSARKLALAAIDTATIVQVVFPNRRFMEFDIALG